MEDHNYLSLSHFELQLVSVSRNPGKMKLSFVLLGAISAAGTAAPDAQFLFSNPPAHHHGASHFTIPTSRQSAVLGRRVLALTPLGTLATVFPPDSDGSYEHRPSGMGGNPVGLPDYIADCEADSVGNPTVLAVTMATSFKNARAGSNVSLSLQWTPRYPPAKRMLSKGPDTSPTTSYSAANLPRFSLFGYLERIVPSSPLELAALSKCFVSVHPDARYWLPGNPIHHSEWQRLVVTHIYWVGGFGDRAYIGWIPVEEWRNVTRAEWEAVELPGEREGWKEWSWDEHHGRADDRELRFV